MEKAEQCPQHYLMGAKQVAPMSLNSLRVFTTKIVRGPERKRYLG